MQNNVTVRDLRFFGLTLGGVFFIIGVWPILWGAPPRRWAFAAALLMIVPALAFPGVLRKGFAGWMALSRILGWLNTRLILGALFFTLFVFVAFLLRLLGKDPMNRKFEPEADTYRVPRPLRQPTHLRHQF